MNEPSALRARLQPIAAARGLLPDDAGPPLARAVRALSDAYNAAAFPVRIDAAMEAARLHFFLPRDASKVAAALRDVSLPDTAGAPLRVLDVGAGIGAATLGLQMALDARGDTRTLVARLVDTDARALELARTILGPSVTTAVADLGRGPAAPADERYDVLLLGQVLVEVAHGRPEAERVALHASILRRLALTHLRPGGRIVVVEPALRRTARSLQAVRNALVEAPSLTDGRRLFVAAPCPHDGVCPLSTQPDDWCHDDLSIDLPAHLVPVARAAGLRWQGLTFARLVLTDQPVARPTLRVAAPVRRQKGRHVLTFCAEGGLHALDRLDRDASVRNAVWDTLDRGDGVALSGPMLPRRVGPDTAVRRVDYSVTVTATDADAGFTSSDTIRESSPGSMK